MSVEERPFSSDGYTASASGRSTFRAVCPFCRMSLVIYVWSFHGHGKKVCPCGATLHVSGMARKHTEETP